MTFLEYVILSVITALSACVIIGAQFVLLREQRKLLHQIRRIAAIYPPFFGEDDEGAKLKPSMTSVQVEPIWDDEAVPRD